MAIFIVIIHEKWVFPFVSWYVNTIHCHNPLGYSGIDVLWYSVLVGLPLFGAFIIGVFTIPMGIGVIRDKQFPPKGFKVFKPTKVQIGWNAKFKSIILLLIPSALVVFSVWGYLQVDQIPHEVPDNIDYSVCKHQL